ncbi:SDR family oxidoreductase [Sphingobium sp. 3R8]|uniref:SDR family NAD(P)-dependent oxidoreductase n=1 Tax=Sphingobium sp. 3R8 TaxID=2874921 RepID=UPI001CCD9DB4|nr:SDR family oxidoreductase [Sphingobium sp. 3R8]MBZ9646868.1 SDR family oxidoreductase [Sphingobium sp. 3R8]
MSDFLNFSGKVVLVVGGSSGIGNAIAQAFRERGASVHVTGTRASNADYAASDGSDLTGLQYSQLDLSDPGAIAFWDPGIASVDTVVLSQGLVLYKRTEFDAEGFQRVLQVNLTSVMQCATLFHDRLAATKGSLIIISSSAAFHATTGNPAYNASKSGAMGLTRTLGRAWAAEGIRVNGIAPGFVATKMTAVTTDNADRRKTAEERIPLGRIAEPAEMVGVALFLASPMSSYVVGQTILADGGMLL